jgi:hypothetical protein
MIDNNVDNKQSTKTTTTSDKTSTDSTKTTTNDTTTTANDNNNDNDNKNENNNDDDDDDGPEPLTLNGSEIAPPPGWRGTPIESNVESVQATRQQFAEIEAAGLLNPAGNVGTNCSHEHSLFFSLNSTMASPKNNNNDDRHESSGEWCVRGGGGGRSESRVERCRVRALDRNGRSARPCARHCAIDLATSRSREASTSTFGWSHCTFVVALHCVDYCKHLTTVLLLDDMLLFLSLLFIY